MKKDKVILRDLVVYAKHGAIPEENVLGQKFLFSLEIYTDFSQAAAGDDLTCAVDYGKLGADVIRFNQEHTWQLIETAAVRTAEHILDKYERVDGLKLRIEKPWAPLNFPLDTVGVEIERFREN